MAGRRLAWRVVGISHSLVLQRGGGWALAYIFKAIVGFSGTTTEVSNQFVELVNSPGLSIMWHSIFMVLTIAIVAGGIKNGIERWSKILMPTLLLILVGLMMYGVFYSPGGMKAIAFLFRPDFSKLTAEGILSALGHAFFTLSLGMGAMITYGSYMERGAKVVRDAVAISILDTLVAILAGLAIFSIVFSYDLEAAAGPGLIFQTLPTLFSELGRWISVPFFLLMTFAALSSAISLLEVVVSYFIDRRGWSRVGATLWMGSAIYVLGLVSCVSALKVPFTELGWFDFFDLLTTNYMLPLGGLLTCIFVAFVVEDKVRREEFGSEGTMYRGFLLTLRFVTPVAVFLVLLHGLGWLPFVEN